MDLCARPVPDVARIAYIAGADQASRYVVDAIVKALHYGMVDMARIASIGQNKAYSRAINDLMEFAGLFAATAQAPEKAMIAKFIAATRKRFERYA
jgi:hypothetical protein